MNTKSSVITNYAYHKGGLEITFNGGRVYRYEAPQHEYDALCTAASKGKHYNNYIKGKFSCYEVPLRKVVDIAFTLGAKSLNLPPRLPEISFCNDVIMIGRTPYGGGAEAVMKFFLSRAEKYLH